MKISFNPAVNYTQAQKINNKAQLATNPNVNNMEIQKNSMAELLGRCQTVSFGAQNRMQGNNLIHECKEGIFGGKESINYNKENGSLRHEIYDKQGYLVRRSEFFPQKGTEIVTEIDEEGNETTTTVTPDYKEVITNDVDKRQTYKDYEEFATGRHQNIDTDYHRGRTVVREKAGFHAPQQIIVVDLRTNKSVTRGPLVYDTSFNKNKGIEETVNIITGQIVKTRQENAKGQLLREVEYFDGAPGVIKREVNYDATKSKYTEAIYSDEKPHNLEKLTITSKNGKEEQIIEYEADGRTIRSNILYRPDSEVHYDSRTGFIDYERKFSAKTWSDTFYNERPNVPSYTQEYSRKDNSKISDTFYFGDGKTVSRKREYNPNGSSKITVYTKDRRVSEIRFLNAQNLVTQVDEYDPDTRYMVQSTKHESDGSKRVTEFDANGIKFRVCKYDSKNKERERITYAEDGKTRTEHIIFNDDNSYTKISFDEYGQESKREEFDEFNRKKTTANNGQQGHQYRYQRREQSSGYQGYSSGNDKWWNDYFNNYGSQSTQGTSQKTRVESDDDFILRMSNVINRSTNDSSGRVVSLFSRLDLNDSDWERLSKLVGASDVQSVKYMDKSTYRKLSMKFHPDVNHEANAEKIFQLINGLYSAQ